MKAYLTNTTDNEIEEGTVIGCIKDSNNIFTYPKHHLNFKHLNVKWS